MVRGSRRKTRALRWRCEQERIQGLSWVHETTSESESSARLKNEEGLVQDAKGEREREQGHKGRRWHVLYIEPAAGKSAHKSEPATDRKVRCQQANSRIRAPSSVLDPRVPDRNRQTMCGITIGGSQGCARRLQHA